MNENLPDGEHNYVFVGKVGRFTPVKEGNNGGTLVRTKTLDDGSVKYDSVVGTKGYRWLQSEDILNMQLDHPEDIVDKTYYYAKVDDAIKSISEYGDTEWFCE